MKVIIAGSRSIVNIDEVFKAIKDSNFTITEVVCGEAVGVDMIGKVWASRNNVPVKKFPAKWGKHGRSAGLIRNVDMACYAEALVAIWNGKSTGTEHMIKIAKLRKLKVYIHYVGTQE